MSFYARLNATARRLIRQYGKDATLVRLVESGPAHDPTVTETEYTVRMVETGYSLTNRNETLVQVGDKLGIISTEGEAPQFDDKLEIGGERYNIVDLQPLNPGGTVLIHEFTARK